MEIERSRIVGSGLDTTFWNAFLFRAAALDFSFWSSELDSESDSDSDSSESAPTGKDVCGALAFEVDLYEGKELDDALFDFFAASFRAFSSAKLSALEFIGCLACVDFCVIVFVGTGFESVSRSFGFDDVFIVFVGELLLEDLV